MWRHFTTKATNILAIPRIIASVSCKYSLKWRNQYFYLISLCMAACTEDTWYCEPERICKASDYLCDGEKDCADGVDEMGCPGKMSTKWTVHVWSHNWAVSSCENQESPVFSHAQVRVVLCITNDHSQWMSDKFPSSFYRGREHTVLNFCKLVFNGVQVHIKQLLLGCKSTSSTSY